MESPRVISTNTKCSPTTLINKVGQEGSCSSLCFGEGLCCWAPICSGHAIGQPVFWGPQLSGASWARSRLGPIKQLRI